MHDTERRQRSLTPRKFFNQREQERILQAIADAELRTSGEIRLYVERDLHGTDTGEDATTQRARVVFDQLGMHQTSQRNGVLIYLATRSRRFAVLGDDKLHARVGKDFWQEIAIEMGRRFDTGHFTAGVIGAMGQIGEKLRLHFPHPPDDRNELADDIAFGD